METEFKVGDIVYEKDQFFKKCIKYKVIEVFKNYWGDVVYQFECQDRAYGNPPYSPRDLAKYAHQYFTKTPPDYGETDDS